MIAAGRAAKSKGPLPPQLWKARHAAPPTWSEFDRLSYREVITTQTLQNIYNVVHEWTTGGAKASAEVRKIYAQLVKDGIIGKDI